MDGSPCLSHMQRVRVKGLIIQLWLLISQQQDRHYVSLMAQIARSLLGH